MKSILKNCKQISFIIFCTLIASCNNGDTPTTTTKADVKKETTTQTNATFINCTIAGKPFATNNPVQIFKMGGYYVIGGENEEYAISLKIAGDVMLTKESNVECTIAKKQTGKASIGYDSFGNTSVIVTSKTENSLAGNFNVTVKNNAGEEIEIKNGSFKADVKN